jgi:hypothetical protein
MVLGQIEDAEEQNGEADQAGRRCAQQGLGNEPE